jgi:hypothetical protein
MNAPFGYNRYEFPQKSHDFVKNMEKRSKILDFGDFRKTADSMTGIKYIHMYKKIALPV